jgi:DNA modification methylase
MNPHVLGDIQIYNGDVLDVLRQLPDDSIDCCVTSPPYWGLRDYGVEGQIGLEPTMQGYLDKMVEVCREVRRVLKADGTLWLNIGDSYHKKSLAMIPNRLAIALCDDGWYVRSEIIWAKPNPMPESVRDRPTSAHEKVWLLTKSARYFYDADAIKECGVIPAGTRGAKGSAERFGTPGVNSRPPEYKIYDGTRNCRNVWTITPKPYRGAHFAVMPPELAERCIKAGCPVGGMVLDPFGGAGTTGIVASRLGRRSTLIELNTDYIEIIKWRVGRDLFTVSSEGEPD